jgi:hypothetical protein
LGSLEKHLLQLVQLLIGKLGVGSSALGLKDLPTMLGHPTPAIEGLSIDSKQARHHGGSFASVERFHNSTAALFEFSSGSKRSCQLRCAKLH